MMSHRSKIFRTLSFIIGLAMLLAAILNLVGIIFGEMDNEFGIVGSLIFGGYFMFYALTGSGDVYKYFKQSK